MQGTIPKQLIDHFKQMLVEGRVYHISGFVIIPAQASYRISGHPFRIRLLRNTFVKVLDDENCSIPFDRFEFLSFEDGRARVGNKTYLTGMCVCVCVCMYIYIYFLN